jgi:hypothetical protein
VAPINATWNQLRESGKNFTATKTQTANGAIATGLYHRLRNRCLAATRAADGTSSRLRISCSLKFNPDSLSALLGPTADRTPGPDQIPIPLSIAAASYREPGFPGRSTEAGWTRTLTRLNTDGMSSEISKPLTDDRVRARLTPAGKSALLLIAGMLPTFGIFLFLGQPELGLGICASMGVLLIALRATWSLRRRAWYWIAVSFSVALQVPFILYVPWSDHAYRGPVLSAAGVLDLILVWGGITLCEKVFSRL